MEKAPAVTDNGGKPVHFRYGTIDTARMHLPVDVNLAPGKEIVLGEVKLSTALWEPGKFSVQYERVLGNASSGTIKLNPRLTGLATGKLELEIKSDPPPPEKKEPRKQEKEKELASFTAWGKEVGGVQAGIGYFPGQKRTYHIGETVKLAVRVRNVGKREVKFSYYHEFFYEHPPIVTDSAGKTIPLEGVFLSGWPRRVDVSLAAGKEVQVNELYLTLRPATARDKERPIMKLFGAGKYQFQYKQMGGNLGIGEPRFDPILGKLVTGKLELEVKSAPPPATRED
jgi:hypothetical protein